MKCKSCGNKLDKDKVVRVGLSNYCSFECSWNKKPAKKKSKPKKVASNKGHVEPISEAVRSLVMRRDSNRCRLCKGVDNLAVHHIYYKSEAKKEVWLNQPHNLITLCNQPCHLTIVHGNKKRFQRLCLGIVWLRETQNDRYTTIYQLEESLKNGI